jgi:hypothetical protein
MISAHVIELIETHADHLAIDVAKDLATNPRTTGLHGVRHEELVQRVFRIYHQLGQWIGEPGSPHVREEFAEWGATRFGQGIPLSQVVYAVIILKTHLRRYIHEHGLVDAAFPRVEADYILPMHLHSLQELNGMVSAFFDEAVYYLAQGYERAAVSAGQRT